jgi:hypothetical protein
MSRILTLVALALLTLAAAAPLTAYGQDATPAGGRDVPDPSECLVGPATAEEVLALFHDVAATATSATPAAADPPSFVQPEGEPADAETAAAVVAATRELLACTNGYGFLGLVAVATDRHIRDVLAQDIAAGVTEEAMSEFLAATPEPPTPEQSVALVDVRDVMVLDDGRIGAVVVGDEPGVGELTLYFIFVEKGGRYLLDEQFEVAMNGTPTP